MNPYTYSQLPMSSSSEHLSYTKICESFKLIDPSFIIYIYKRVLQVTKSLILIISVNT